MHGTALFKLQPLDPEGVPTRYGRRAQLLPAGCWIPMQALHLVGKLMGSAGLNATKTQ